MPKEKIIDFTTKLDTRDIAQTFQSAVTQSLNIIDKIYGRLSSGTPNDNDPFSAIDETPTFGVYTGWIPRIKSAEVGMVWALHLYIYDLGDKRRVELVRVAGLGKRLATDRRLQKVLTAFQSADPTLSVQ